MKKVLKAKAAAPKPSKEKKVLYKGNKVTLAQAVFQAPVDLTPKPWINEAKKRRIEARILRANGIHSRAVVTGGAT